MVGALRGAGSCGRCGTDLPPAGTRYCTRCGAPAVAAAPGSALGTYSGLLGGVQLAAPNRRRLATAIDAFPALALVAVGIVVAVAPAVPGGTPWPAIGAAALALLVYAAAQLSARALVGRSLGRLILGLRTVDDLTGEPPEPLPWRRQLARRTITVDLRRGRDPLSPGVTPLGADALGAEALASAAVPSAAPQAPVTEDSPLVVLVLDSGERLELHTSLLIGRLPTNPDGEEHAVFAWPDLSRSISKTHAMLEWSGSVLWVTDLGSTNGTSLVSPDGARQPLVAGLRGPAAPGWSIELGERRLAVQASGVVGALQEVTDGR